MFPKLQILLKYILSLLLVAILITNCNDDDYVSIPDVYINYDINLNLPQFSNLIHTGNYVYLDNEGYKGVIIYHTLDDQYIALERTCTHQPLMSCSKVYVDDSGLFIHCGENEGDCCESRFEMDGSVLRSPAVYPLKQYAVTRHGDVLTITNSY